MNWRGEEDIREISNMLVLFMTTPTLKTADAIDA